MLASLAGAASLALLSGTEAQARVRAAGIAPPRVGNVASADPAAVKAAYFRARPSSWGDQLPGIMGRLPFTHRKVNGVWHPVAALTFDACGNPSHGSNGYDAKLISVLRAHRVPATLFLSARWLMANPGLAAALCRDPLFAVGDHGTRHVPLSVTGRSAYGIAGTRSASEAVDEVWTNVLELQQLLGHRPTLFRSGTALYDDVAVAIVRSLGLTPVGYSVNCDFGATADTATVARQLLSLRPGNISIGHVNHPERSTAEGLALALPRLLRAGWLFAHAGDTR